MRKTAQKNVGKSPQPVKDMSSKSTSKLSAASKSLILKNMGNREKNYKEWRKVSLGRYLKQLIR